MQKLLIVGGVLAILAGLLWPWLSQLPLGRLPGDILIETEGGKFYFPITTMIVVSLLISGLAWLFRQ